MTKTIMSGTGGGDVGEQDPIARAIQEIAKRAAEAIEELKEINRHALAKGSRDITQQAAEAHAQAQAQEAQVEVERKAEKQPLEIRIKEALCQKSFNPKQLAKHLKAPHEDVKDELSKLDKARRIFNVGFADSPLWIWRIGDKTGTPELIQMVQQLISERPMSRQQLVDVTGAGVKRVDGALVEIRRGPLSQRIANLSPQTHAATWFLFPEGMAAAPLAKRLAKGSQSQAAQPKSTAEGQEDDN